MIALLNVHGIGEQRRGQTTEKWLVGLKAAYGDAMPIEHDADNYPVAVTANGQTVRLYEVYWADVLSAEKSRGTFTWHILNTLVWHPAWCRQLGLLPSPEYSSAIVWWRVCSGVRVQNGMALFTLFGWTMGMLLQMQDRRNDAKHTCESARRSSG